LLLSFTIQTNQMQKLFFGLALAILFFSCAKEKRDCPSSTEKNFSNSAFKRIAAGGTFDLKIKQGATFNITAKGCANDLNELVLSEENTVLTINYRQHRNDRYKVYFEITVPILNGLALDGSATASVSGFGQQTSPLRTALSGVATCTVDQTPVLIDADLSGASKLSLSGNTPDLISHLSGTAQLNAYQTTVHDADIYTSGTAKAYVLVQNSLAAFASGDSRVYYKGNPASVSVEQSGTAKVIRE